MGKVIRGDPSFEPHDFSDEIRNKPVEEIYYNKYLTCVTCGEKFLFSELEQKYYEEYMFNEPLRCEQCRDRGRFKKSPEWSEYYCAGCGEKRVVPFVPRFNSKIYCKNCRDEFERLKLRRELARRNHDFPENIINP